MRTVLSSLVFPNVSKNETEMLYIRCNDYTIIDKNLLIKQGNCLSMDTYFNSFAYDNYVDYTKVEKIYFCFTLVGKGTVELFCQTKEKIIKLENITHIGNKNYQIPVYLKKLPLNGVLWLRFLTDKESLTVSAYRVEADCVEVNNVKLSIVICTYQREVYVHHTIEKFRQLLRSNPKLCEHLDVFVIDNGRTLKIINDENINIIPNKNYGGSGGFARGMIEALESKKNFTHILLMDDDIEFEVETILRLLSFLSIEFESEKPCIFGGHMLVEEQPTVQFEAGGRFENGRLLSLHHNKDVSLFASLLENQNQTLKAQYQAWWFCCLSVKTVKKVGLPLPFFIKTDDVEYGLRCDSPIVLMNGIGVWHSSFDSKITPYLEYYIKRNELIVSSLYGEGDGACFSFYKYLRSAFKAVSIGNPNNIDFITLGYEHFLNGALLFEEIESDKLHNKILELNKKKKNRVIALLSLPFLVLKIGGRLLFQYKKSKLSFQNKYTRLSSIELWKKKLTE